MKKREKKVDVSSISKAAAQYTLQHTLSKWPAVKAHESSAFLAQSPGERRSSKPPARELQSSAQESGPSDYGLHQSDL